MFFSENYQARNISFESDWGGGLSSESLQANQFILLY